MSTYMEIVETVDGQWMILVNGFQWGHGPYDRSGCSSQTWATKELARDAWEHREEQLPFNPNFPS